MSTFLRTGTTSDAPPSPGATALRWTVRVVLAAYALMGLAATAYFTFFAAPEDGGVATFGDGLVALWNVVIGICMLVAAVRLGNVRTSQPLRLAQGAVVAHIVFGLVKYFGYGEREAVGFFVFDLALLALLLVFGRTSRTA
jgi:peptidoglycan/LPS O-acetylase OafA/YrhL